MPPMNLDALPPVIQLCRELVRIPSPSGGEGALAAFVAARMARGGLRVATDPWGTVLGIRQGREPGPVLLLDAHMDVVPVPDPAAWSRDPWGGELADGRLWGRGAADTKASLAAMICAAETVDLPRGTLVVSASVCEENLTAAALSHVLDEHPVDAVIVGEPTLLRLGTAQKGRAGIVVEAAGRSAHTSRPELGDNAVYRMIEAVARLRALPLPTHPELGRGVCELIEIVSEPRPSPGMVPHRCTARFALRVLPGETADSVQVRFREALGDLSGVTVRLDELAQACSTGRTLTLSEFVPAWTSGGTDLQARLLDALGTKPFAAPYTTNASAAAARGIPAFLLGPGSIEQAHIVDEWVATEQLEAAVAAYAAVIRTCLGPRP